MKWNLFQTIITVLLFCNISLVQCNIVTESIKLKVTRPQHIFVKKYSQTLMINEIKKFLNYNGYSSFSKEIQKALDKKYTTLSEFAQDDNVKHVIKIAQMYSNLKPTGILNQETINQFKSLKCGSPHLGALLEMNSESEKKPERYDHQVAKWGKSELTWKLIYGTYDMDEKSVLKAIEKAFSYWAEYTPLEFKKVKKDSDADLVLYFGTRSHGDNYAFDGPNGVLAHAFLPRNGHIHFDDDENFTEGTSKGINLRIVAAHEIGHALGLLHSMTPGALMYPYYSYIEGDKNILHQDDIMGIRSLYDRKESGKFSEPTTTTQRSILETHSTKMVKKNSSVIEVPPCSELAEAVFLGPNDQLLVLLRGKLVWEYDEMLNAWKDIGDIAGIYPQLEPEVRGGVRCNKGYTWFFKNVYVWAYDRNKLIAGFPKQINDRFSPFNPYTAVNRNGEILLLKGNKAWKFDTESLKIIDHPELISDSFKNIPNWIEAWLKYKRQEYFFKYQSIFTYDVSRGQYVEQDKLKTWKPCINPKLV